MRAESTILVVDDDPAISQGLVLLLDQAGFVATSAAGGNEAWSYLMHHPSPQLIILDVVMPDLDGLSLCRQIRTLPTYIPILMLSARDEAHDTVVGLELGADEYVTKPFNPHTLLARVNALLRLTDHLRSGKSAAASNSMVYGVLRFMRTERRVEIAGRTIQLTPHEWQLLDLMINEPGRVFGREMLLQGVWGADYLGTSRAVDMLVQRLRSKIEPDPSKPRYIQTVHGFGYRFSPNESHINTPNT